MAQGASDAFPLRSGRRHKLKFLRREALLNQSRSNRQSRQAVTNNNRLGFDVHIPPAVVGALMVFHPNNWFGSSAATVISRFREKPGALATLKPACSMARRM